MRVFLGITNNAGVLTEYRKGLRRLGVDARVIVNRPHRYGYFHDEVIRTHENPLFRRFQGFNHMIRFIRDFDIFHFFSGASIIPLHIDVPFLKMANKKILMSFMGSDIRCSIPVLEGIEDRGKCNYCKLPCRISRKKKKVNFWARNADAIMSGVDNSQLLDYYSIPYFVITLPCDIEYWRPFDSTFYRKKEDEILIVHAPSNMRRKGTSSIIDSIKKLKNKHKVSFKLLYNLPNSVVREWLNVADIVIDQFGVGWHGVLAVESMALSKPTLCGINNEYKQRYPQFSDIPIQTITPSNLYSVLEYLVIDQSLRENIGRKSRKYVEKNHDSKIVCKNLLDIYNKIYLAD